MAKLSCTSPSLAPLKSRFADSGIILAFDMLHVEAPLCSAAGVDLVNRAVLHCFDNCSSNSGDERTTSCETTFRNSRVRLFRNLLK